MNVGEIIKDAARYPFSDWKKIMIFGFIILFNRMDWGNENFKILDHDLKG